MATEALPYVHTGDTKRLRQTYYLPTHEARIIIHAHIETADTGQAVSRKNIMGLECYTRVRQTPAVKYELGTNAGTDRSAVANKPRCLSRARIETPSSGRQEAMPTALQHCPQTAQPYPFTKA